MKTILNVHKIIDWSTEVRPIIGKKYYFGETIWDLENSVKNGFVGSVLEDRDFDFKLSYNGSVEWANFLYPMED